MFYNNKLNRSLYSKPLDLFLTSFQKYYDFLLFVFHSTVLFHQPSISPTVPVFCNKYDNISAIISVMLFIFMMWNIKLDTRYSYPARIIIT